MHRPLLAAALASVLLAFAAPAQALQCVPFARMESGLAIRGDAWTWWNEAAGIYERGQAPRVGSVLVFKRHNRMVLGHVSVVTKVVNSREILVDHANWGSGRGDRGRVNTHVGVRDVSPNNDWTEVRVWNTAINDFGTGDYPTYGFIYANHPNPRLEVQSAVYHATGRHKVVREGHGVVEVSLTSAHKPGHVVASRTHKVAAHVVASAHGKTVEAKAAAHTHTRQAALHTAAPAHHAAVAATVVSKKAPAHHQAKAVQHGHKPAPVEQKTHEAPALETASLGSKGLPVKLDLPTNGTYAAVGDMAQFELSNARGGKF